MSNNKIYYYVEAFKDNYKIIKCILKKDNIFDMIIPFKEDGTLDNFARSFDKNSLCETEKEANEKVKYLDKLYNKTLQNRPFLNEEILVQNLDKLITIETDIRHKLDGFPHFAGIDFCDVSAGGIQIRGHHAQIKGYTYGNQITIDYDFNNYIECIDRFVEMWKEQDKPEKVRAYKSFIADGERWGWD